MGSSLKTNRLGREKSPYLLQHARNPVDWYPWGEEAFDRARREDKLVFLSIGYSTCHWCHVREKESFEDEDVARLMNDAFVSIKVDREERPDLDNYYMAVCQMLTGGGGWPLSVILTPDKKPIFAGTYFPKQARYNRIGLVELIPRVQALWKTNRAGAVVSGDKIQTALEEISRVPAAGDIPEDIADMALEHLKAAFDGQAGGFGSAPKFPSPHNIFFLLRAAARDGGQEALDMAVTTLRSMRRGGIWDHLGFGFHRYATDRFWRVPHFEKMLYDQALLSMAYVEAYQVTADQDFRRAAEETLTYVLRDMTSPEGGFYSAEDADSEGREGKFYTWPEKEVRAILNKDEAELAVRVFSLDPKGNFEEGAQGGDGRNILYLTGGLDRVAAELKVPEEELRARIGTIRNKMLSVRQKRVPPFKDTKVLTDWNGLMIAALAKAGQAFGDPVYARAAQRAADFLLGKMGDSRDRLRHRFLDGSADITGFLDDYAYLTWGLLELYETVFDPRYLGAALEFVEVLIAHFWDETRGGFFFTADDSTELPLRKKEGFDGALPSGNSVMVMNLTRLGRMTGRVGYEDRAMAVVRAFTPQIANSPTSFAHLLSGLDFTSGPGREVVIVGVPDAADTQKFLQALRARFLPTTVVLLKPAAGAEEIERLAPFTAGMRTIDGKAAAYVCSNLECRQPTTDPQRMMNFLKAT